MPCHAHCTFSLPNGNDGLGDVHQHAVAAREAGLPWMAMTDHGSASSWYPWEDACKAEGIKPVFGIEAYFVKRRKAPEGEKEDGSNDHLLLLAKNLEGVRNISKLSSLAYTDGFYRKPRVDFELLRMYHEGVVATSACIGSFAGRNYIGDDHTVPDPAVARQWIEDMGKIFGDDFYLEMMPNDLEAQRRYNKFLYKMECMQDKLIASNDSHFPRREDIRVQHISSCIIKNTRLSDPDPYRASPNLYVKNLEEIYEDLQSMTKVPEDKAALAVENTARLMESLNVTLPRGLAELAPSYENAREKIRERLLEGRRKIILDDLSIPDEKIDVYDERLRYEAELIDTKGFNDYFLVVSELVEAAREMDIIRGPARGSAGGSLVSYLLGITQVDPIEHDLPFERFLSPERGGPDMSLGLSREEISDLEEHWDDTYGDDVSAMSRVREECENSDRFSVEYEERLDTELRNIEWQELGAAYCALKDLGKKVDTSKFVVAYLMGIADSFDSDSELPQMPDLPDIDLDFAERERLVTWLKERWGEEYVYDLANFNKMGIKDSIERTAKVLEVKVPRDIMDEIDAEFPSIEAFLKSDKAVSLDSYETAYPGITDVIKSAARVEGNIHHLGGTAAGVLVSAKPVTDYVPLIHFKNTHRTTASCDKRIAEDLGFVKMDVLGVTSLKIVRDTRDIARGMGIEDLPPIWEAPKDDKKVMRIFKRVETGLIFQFSKPPMKRLLKSLKPDSFSEIVAAMALVRSGADDKSYIEGKKGNRDLTQAHPLVQEILKETYGTLVYQEQMMELCRIVGRLRSRDVNLVRKLTSKKIANAENMARPKRLFLKGAKKNGVSEEEAERLWETIEETGKYSFNKAHSVAYSLVSWEMAYYQVHYPKAFFTACLRYADSQAEEDLVRRLLKKRGISQPFTTPDANKSEWGWSVYEGDIVPGFSAIHGIGEKLARAIVAEREANGPFTDMEEMTKRMKGKGFGKKAAELLKNHGAAPGDDGLGLRQGIWKSEARDILKIFKKEIDQEYHDTAKYLGEVKQFDPPCWVQVYLKKCEKNPKGPGYLAFVTSNGEELHMTTSKNYGAERPALAIAYWYGGRYPRGYAFLTIDDEHVKNHPMRRTFEDRVLPDIKHPDKTTVGFAYAFPTEKFKNKDGYEYNATPILNPEPMVINVDEPIKERGYYFFGYLGSDGGGQLNKIFRWVSEDTYLEKMAEQEMVAS